MAPPLTGDSDGTGRLPTFAVMTTTPPANPSSRARTTRRALLGGGIGTLALVAGGSAWAADRYLVDHVEIDSASAYEASRGAVSAATARTGGTVSGTTYTSDLATIDISTTVVGSGTDQVTYFVADVVLTDATALRSAFANDEFGRNIIDVPSAIAASVDAAFAVNGDYYGFRDNGIVIRDGTVFRSEGARGGLAFHRDGTIAPLRRDRCRCRPAGEGRCVADTLVRPGPGRSRQARRRHRQRGDRHQLRQPLHPRTAAAHRDRSGRRPTTCS